MTAPAPAADLEPSAEPAPQKPGLDARATTGTLAFFAFACFVTFLTQGPAVAKLPLNYVLKDQLHATADELASFYGISGFFAYTKPVFGLFSDHVPLFGTRRRSYLLLGAAFTVGAWLVVGAMPLAYAPLLVGMMMVNAGVMLSGTVIGALTVDIGAPTGTTGRLTSLRFAMQQVMYFTMGPLGAWLAARRLGFTVGICAAMNAALFAATFVMLRERRDPNAVAAWSAVRRDLVALVRNRTLWLVAALILLDELSPGLGSSFFYRMTEHLHLSKGDVGNWYTGLAIGGLASSAVYAWLHRRVKLRRLLLVGLFAHALGSALVLLVETPASVMPVAAGYAFLQFLATLPLIDLAARATPSATAALCYAVVISAYNLGMNGGDVLGATLFQRAHVRFEWLVAINGGSTFVVVPLVLLLPAAVAGLPRPRVEPAG